MLLTGRGWFLYIWGWDFLVGTSEGRLLLSRFLVTVRPGWTMHEHFQYEASDGDLLGLEAQFLNYWFGVPGHGWLEWGLSLLHWLVGSR